MEKRGLGEVEAQLRRIEHVKNEDLMPERRQRPEPLLEGVRGREQIGDEHDEPALAHQLTDPP